ncbi:DUF1189 domain-containing protein [Bacillus sp. FJAT-42376]|uniref:DUF1189 domain-containing protein n=1 Tax=Bacillus sp. FJAT-42376 TaxID=2014076 RepID=UPI000F4FBE4E|nr:DUF1189 domain-containing protein [Bacillus sp. FJAT-42376]AZB43638.1 DUF1189 domain-containing protein [Bacillus sp. FJAT-42376]
MNIFKQMAKSLYSPKDIAVFRFQGIGKTILYIFFLTLISILPASVFLGLTIGSSITAIQNTVNSSLPDFEIKDGTLTAQTDKPVEIKQGEIIIVLDPTGTYTAKEMEQKNNSVGILKNEFVLVSNGSPQVISYTSAGNFTITKAQIADFAKQTGQLKPVIIAAVLILLYLVSSFSKFIEVTILALLGLVIRNMLKKKVNFKQSWVMSAYAVTLATLFFTIMTSLQAAVPSQGLVQWFVHIVMLYLAVKEIPSKTEPAAIT